MGRLEHRSGEWQEMRMNRQGPHPERLRSGLLPKNDGNMNRSLDTMWRTNWREKGLKIERPVRRLWR